MESQQCLFLLSSSFFFFSFFLILFSSFQDMNRQVVKSEFATVRIPELEFEIPPTTRNGNLTTVEGILQKIIEGLSSDQAVRKVLHPAFDDPVSE